MNKHGAVPKRCFLSPACGRAAAAGCGEGCGGRGRVAPLPFCCAPQRRGGMGPRGDSVRGWGGIGGTPSAPRVAPLLFGPPLSHVARSDVAALCPFQRWRRGGAAASGTAARGECGRCGAARSDGGAGAARAARGAAGSGGERREAAQHAACPRPCGGLSGSWSRGGCERDGVRGRGPLRVGVMREGSGGGASGCAPVTVSAGRGENRGAGPSSAGAARGLPWGPPRR